MCVVLFIYGKFKKNPNSLNMSTTWLEMYERIKLLQCNIKTDKGIYFVHTIFM